ncbi:MAG: glycosyltransferase family 4 protein [Spirochaetes bacterium]|nr:glycosyltransferase family 4 protein [Spirochaetota bacterium]
MLRLIIDCRMINSSGIGVYLQNLIPYLKNHFSLTLLGNPDEIRKYQWHNNSAIINFFSPIYSVKEQIGYPLKIKKSDIFWTPHYNIPVFPVRAKKRVATVHDLNHIAFSSTLSFKQKLYARFMVKKVVTMSDKIITDSFFSYNEIMKYTNGVHDKKISVINLGIDRNIFKQIHKKNILLKVAQKYNLPQRFILYVGNVKPHKNLKSLLKAFHKLLIEKTNDLSLIIVGKKEGFLTGASKIFTILEENASLKEKVIFTGFVENEELPVFYNLASVFVFPSLYEGFGLPPLEAMACGCPAIVSGTSSLPEICGDAAYYINPLNTDEIADKICTVLIDEDLRQELVTKGIERVKRYNWEESARKHIELFKGVI